ncbi:SLOG family protein [Kurthia sp. Dielmo]|uniref:SLOG family protein n=1 Tax=Kurthia sp. Dielmo TaxID=1033738 RepID=UPI00111F6313|nr:SLOG family protein [Kurthia sp. Dielmo]
MFRLVIAGSRTFTDYAMLDSIISNMIRHLDHSQVEIISGHARGADRTGERFARKNNLKLHIMPADWSKHGNAAGHIRNREMANRSDAVVCFWDGKSPGTRGMIEYSRSIGKMALVVNYT